METIDAITEQLKKALSGSLELNSSCSLLLSGGLDTSILACLSPKTNGITVSLGSESDDIPYARLLTNFLNMEYHHRIVDIDEAIEAIPEVIKILKSFDPAIPNDLTVYFGLKKAKELSISAIATGDGSDELFAGYSFMEDIDDLETYIRKISENMTFSSNDIGEFFGIKIIQPFIEGDMVDFALKVPMDLKIRKHNGKTCGKWILRKAFESMLPENIIWQSKRPLEYGSGMTNLRNILSAKISDEEFKENDSSIEFISKEHFYYYKIYKDVIGEIPKPEAGEDSCPNCGAGMKKGGIHCKICGYVLDRRS